ncbi:MAG: rRNA pseudouridine synthase [Candidatus Brocadiae bacterium]|nr:rRNA pseudouridine synthase [Candidatus Brocadiia bacterium]
MERLQKILAAAGLGSRRECEELILQGRVSVDDVIVKETGTKADPETQRICCDGEPIKQEKKRCFLFYKPKNCVCTNAEGQDLKVVDFFKSVSYRLFTIGRLDKDSEGLILVTNDGNLTQTLAHPRYEVEKVYRITVRGRVSVETVEKLREGIWISEGKVMPKNLRFVKASQGSSILEMTLAEGKNRVIRRVFAKVGHPVSRLVRIRLGIFEIGDLKPGRYRSVTDEELQKALELGKKNKKTAGSNKKTDSVKTKAKKER